MTAFEWLDSPATGEDTVDRFGLFLTELFSAKDPPIEGLEGVFIHFLINCFNTWQNEMGPKGFKRMSRPFLQELIAFKEGTGPAPAELVRSARTSWLTTVLFLALLIPGLIGKLALAQDQPGADKEEPLTEAEVFHIFPGRYRGGNIVMTNEKGEERLISEHKAFVNDATKLHRQVAAGLKEEERVLSLTLSVGKEIEDIQLSMAGPILAAYNARVDSPEARRQLEKSNPGLVKARDHIVSAQKRERLQREQQAQQTVKRHSRSL